MKSFHPFPVNSFIPHIDHAPILLQTVWFYHDYTLSFIAQETQLFPIVQIHIAVPLDVHYGDTDRLSKARNLKRDYIEYLKSLTSGPVCGITERKAWRNRGVHAERGLRFVHCRNGYRAILLLASGSRRCNGQTANYSNYAAGVRL